MLLNTFAPAGGPGHTKIYIFYYFLYFKAKIAGVLKIKLTNKFSNFIYNSKLTGNANHGRCLQVASRFRVEPAPVRSALERVVARFSDVEHVAVVASVLYDVRNEKVARSQLPGDAEPAVFKVGYLRCRTSWVDVLNVN